MTLIKFNNLRIVLKKNYIIVFLNKTIFFKQSIIKFFNYTNDYLTKFEFFFFYVLHVLSHFGFINNLKKKK